jgi:hypothetical protein
MKKHLPVVAVCPFLFCIIASASLREGIAQTTSHRDSAIGDERELLVYSYKKLRAQLPTTMFGPEQVQKSLDGLRHRANRYAVYAKDRNVDRRIEALYAVLISAIDAAADYFRELDRIDRGILAKRDQARTDAAFDAGFAGGYVATAGSRSGGSRGDAALAGIAAAAITYIVEGVKKGQELDEVKRQAIENASDGFKRKMSQLNAREQSALDALSQEYAWSRDDKGDFIDSYSRLEKELEQRYAKASSPKETVEASREIEAAVGMIPPARLYDEHRAYALYWAARGATWAAREELSGKKWGIQEAPSAQYAIQLWDRTSKYAHAINQDGGGASEMREQRAWALAYAGKLDEAMAEATAVADLRKGDPEFAFRYACLCSRMGDPTNVAIGWLKVALKNGDSGDVIIGGVMMAIGNYVALEDVKADVNLDDLRTQRPKEFAELVTPKWSWSIKFGILTDDIVMTNESPFTLTNVVLKARIESGEKVWTPTLTAKTVKPGAAQTWANIVSIPGGKVSKSSATLLCDQGK